MLDQAPVGSLLTGMLALASQIVAETRCYTSCKRVDGEYCEPTCQFGFMDTTLVSMERPVESDDMEKEP